jgi:hypothetical protein
MSANDGDIRQLQEVLVPERDSSVHADSWYERNKRLVVAIHVRLVLEQLRLKKHEASVVNTMGCFGSNVRRTDAVQSACFKYSKAFCFSLSQVKGVFPVSCVRCLEMRAQFLINRR